MLVISVVGARPQFIKAAAVSRALRRRHREVLVHTGQHYDYGMSAVFFQELDIPEPDVNLGIGSGPHGQQTGRMLMALEEFLLRFLRFPPRPKPPASPEGSGTPGAPKEQEELEELRELGELRERPVCVLVYGDTNSTLAAALAAVKLGIPVAHVEAGLRSFNRAMPEEHNRVLTDHCADLLFCPTPTAVDLLAREGITRGVHLVGDVMVDALLAHADLARRRSTVLHRLGLTPRRYLLATVHRPYNTDVPEHLRSIFAAFAEVHRITAEPIVLPLHPRTAAALRAIGLEPPAGVIAVDPVGYLDMLALEQSARLILTDSGGVQKEAYCFAVPCVTLRPETEWVETVQAGWNVVVGADRQAIVEAATARPWPGEPPPPVFGDGRAAERIVQVLEQTFA
ncbi:MAG: UDP-N-acetylglucosamine 2-epimerase (non-hydrolyzing) [Caldilineales bacterium]|nr:UDP-N-acetylglucosamine 2-epimerase (non-hydrolyzing) [Caldilineales bacterium]